MIKVQYSRAFSIGILHFVLLSCAAHTMSNADNPSLDDAAALQEAVGEEAPAETALNSTPTDQKAPIDTQMTQAQQEEPASISAPAPTAPSTVAPPSPSTPVIHYTLKPSRKTVIPEAMDELSAEGREEALFARLKSVVKKMERLNRRDIPFPVKSIQSAIQTEFIRFVEGNRSVSWLPRRRLREADKVMAFDNFDLMLTYSEYLIEKAPRKPLSKAKLKELKMLAAKYVIDACNAGHEYKCSLTHVGSMTGKLSRAGQNEFYRRQRLLGHLVAGKGYRGISGRSLDEVNKRYQRVLAQAATEYETLASLIRSPSMEKKAMAKKTSKRKHASRRRFASKPR